jgi:hypothetical protein
MAPALAPALALWGAPLLLALASLVGLLAALLGDGVWDALSWLGLGAPVAVTGWMLARGRRAG